MNPRDWFSQPFWRNRGGEQRAVIDQWAALRNLPLVVQDILLRGGAFATQPSRTPAGEVDQHQTLIDLGRRQLALEILKTSGLDPAEVWRSIEAAQAAPPRERTRP